MTVVSLLIRLTFRLSNHVIVTIFVLSKRVI